MTTLREAAVTSPLGLEMTLPGGHNEIVEKWCNPARRSSAMVSKVRTNRCKQDAYSDLHQGSHGSANKAERYTPNVSSKPRCLTAAAAGDDSTSGTHDHESGLGLARNRLIPAM
jgi:hypothetical protein